MSIKDIIGKNIAVHCDTEEKANRFLQECENLDFFWDRPCSLPTTHNRWGYYEFNTCYKLYMDHTISFGSVDDYVGNEILSFDKLSFDS